MKKWKLFLTSVAALLLMVVTPLSALAATPTDAPTPTPTPVARPVLRGALAMVAPHVVTAGHQMSLTVLVRSNQEAANGVGIWAIPQANIAAARAAIKTLRQTAGAGATEQDYRTILDANGTLLGRTNDNGRLYHVFDNPARLVLVAVKAQYAPDFSALAVKQVLAVSTPKRALAGATVTVTVHEKGAADPVSGASVWAIPQANAPAVRAQLAQTITANKGNLPNVDWDTVLAGLTTSLGKTDASGHVTRSFTAGRYVIIATKKGSVPAYTQINVVAPPTPTPTPGGTPSGAIARSAK